MSATSPLFLVKNVSISDAVSGQIVFQRVFSWKVTTAFSNLGSLIQVFYQFAREVDDGVITGIDFQAPPRNCVRRKRDDVLKEKRSETMQMVTVKTDEITVSIFFDLDGHLAPSIEMKNRFRTLLQTIKLAFEMQFLPALIEWRASSLGQAPNVDEPPSQTAPGLRALEETVDRLAALVSSPTPAHAPGPAQGAVDTALFADFPSATAMGDEAVDQQARAYLRALGILPVPDHPPQPQPDEGQQQEQGQQAGDGEGDMGDMDMEES